MLSFAYKYLPNKYSNSIKCVVFTKQNIVAKNYKKIIYKSLFERKHFYRNALGYIGLNLFLINTPSETNSFYFYKIVVILTLSKYLNFYPKKTCTI